MEQIKREERLENVTRIAKARDYQQAKVMDRINQDNQRGIALMNEKQELLNRRIIVRKQAEKQKMEVMQKFEHLKNKGNISPQEL